MIISSYTSPLPVSPTSLDGFTLLDLEFEELDLDGNSMNDSAVSEQDGDVPESMEQSMEAEEQLGFVLL